jgi:hypothetical protein
MTASPAQIEWFTRYGAKFEGKVQDVDLARGTASYAVREKCTRCGGAGGWKGWPGFTCYRCGGECFEPWSTAHVYTADKLAKLNAAEVKRNNATVIRQQAAQAAKQAERDVRLAAFRAANTNLVEGLALHAAGNGFLGSLAAQLEDRGSLTPNQVQAALAAIVKANAAIVAKRASTHVGEPGKRIELVLAVEHVIHLESNLPSYYHAAPSSIYLCRTPEGARVVYKGSGSLAQKGETVKVKATVSEHGERDGEQQTIIARPKVLGTLAEDGKFYIWNFETNSQQEVK